MNKIGTTLGKIALHCGALVMENLLHYYYEKHPNLVMQKGVLKDGSTLTIRKEFE